MLQVIQYQKTGKLSVEELPIPELKPGGVLVRNMASVISAGTERTSVETAQASLLGKARTRPDLVKQVMENTKREGVRATIKKVQNRLDNYKELGYSSSGVVLESSVDSFRPGDRVACAGQAYHAEVIFIPRNLVAVLPTNVSFDEAAFTTLAAIAMQGVRQANIHVGETVAVIGLGLIGLLTVQILRASGCRVLGFDIAKNNFELAKELGCDKCFTGDTSAISSVSFQTRGYGVDACIVTASSSSTEPVDLGCQIARKKSRIVVVGSVPMDIKRSPFYEKELELTIACSYGPGRYDPQYEIGGNDYPIGYVRWTENRNMDAVLDLMAQRKLDVRPLISHRFKVTDALKAYELVTGKKKEPYTGIVLQYPEGSEENVERINLAGIADNKRSSKVELSVGFIGAGNFAQSYLLPSLQKLNVRLCGIATSRPVNAKSVAQKFGFDYCTANSGEILGDETIDTVFIATRHDTHATMVLEALKNGKNVFVEKPLSLHEEQLKKITQQMLLSKDSALVVMVGFNRRFSPSFKEVKRFLSGLSEPKVISYRVNAGILPVSHWMKDPAQGGRIVGEACHFIDCMSYLTDSLPVRVYAESLPVANQSNGSTENIIVNIRFSDGSIGNLQYLANGDPAAGKEYCEVHCGGRTAIVDNFSEVILFKGGKRTTIRQNGSKGHDQEVKQFVDSLTGKPAELIPFQSLYATTLATFKILESLRKGTPVDF